jgi:hypothetical protein
MSLILDGSVGVSDVDGSAATPAIRGTDANTGMFFPAADTIAFSEGGVESMRLDSSGNLGIGTNSPTNPLTIASSTTLAAGSPSVVLFGASNNERFAIYSSAQPVYSGFKFNGTYASPTAVITNDILVDLQGRGYDTTTYGLGTRVVGSASETWTSTSRAASLIFYTTPSGSITNTERMRIDPTGNLGIGTNSPVAKLDIIAGSARMLFTNQSATAFFTAVNTTNTAYAPMAINGTDVIFKTNDAERMRITAAGDVGIGTSSPNARLNVVGGTINQSKTSGDNNGLFISVGDTSNSYLRVSNSFGNTDYVQANGASIVNVNGSQPWYVATGGAERVRIDSSGSLIHIGGTGAGAWGILGANNAAAAYPVVNIGVAMAWNFSNGGRESAIMNNDQDGSGFIFSQRTAVSNRNTLATASRVGVWTQGNNSSAWTTVSDERIKQNIRPISSALEKVASLKPCHFEYIDKAGKIKTGFIAQEFETVFPGHIVEQQFVPPEYKDAIPEGEKLKGIDADLIPYLVKAIQEQQVMIEELKAKVAALEAA